MKKRRKSKAITKNLPDPGKPTPERQAKGCGIRGGRSGRSVRKCIDIALARGWLGAKDGSEAQHRYAAGMEFIRLYVLAVESCEKPAQLDWGKLAVGVGSERRVYSAAEEHERQKRYAADKKRYWLLYQQLAKEDFGPIGRSVMIEVLIANSTFTQIEEKLARTLPGMRGGLAAIMLRSKLDSVRKILRLQ